MDVNSINCEILCKSGLRMFFDAGNTLNTFVRPQGSLRQGTGMYLSYSLQLSQSSSQSLWPLYRLKVAVPLSCLSVVQLVNKASNCTCWGDAIVWFSVISSVIQCWSCVYVALKMMSQEFYTVLTVSYVEGYNLFFSAFFFVFLPLSCLSRRLTTICRSVEQCESMQGAAYLYTKICFHSNIKRTFFVDEC